MHIVVNIAWTFPSLPCIGELLTNGASLCRAANCASHVS